jgi:dTDP-4-dehydrorhamnose reductase
MGAKASQKILITGGSGNLGTEIRKHLDCYAPDANELDVTDFASCERAIKKYKPDIVLHCAAWTDVAGAEKNKEKCWAVNVTGTENIMKSFKKRFVFISTDYVFDGEKGNYSEDDIPNPQNFYSLTKLAGELIVRQYPSTLIIRTAFKKDGPWPYERAFTDQWVSHEFVSAIAPQIARAVTMTELIGVIHIAGERKSIYELAKRVSPNVGKMSIKNAGVKLPKDTSLNISKWKKILSRSNRVKK